MEPRSKAFTGRGGSKRGEGGRKVDGREGRKEGRKKGRPVRGGGEGGRTAFTKSLIVLLLTRGVLQSILQQPQLGQPALHGCGCPGLNLQNPGWNNTSIQYLQRQTCNTDKHNITCMAEKEKQIACHMFHCWLESRGITMLVNISLQHMYIVLLSAYFKHGCPGRPLPLSCSMKSKPSCCMAPRLVPKPPPPPRVIVHTASPVFAASV